MYKIINFYKFKKLENIILLEEKIYRFLSENSITGTVLIANEGINVNLCGEKENIDKSINYIKTLIDTVNIHINHSVAKENVFKRLKTKIKKEIIKIGFSLNQRLSKNMSLGPEDWDKLLDKDITLLDVRNRFENALGTFDNAIDLDLLNFNDFAKNLYKLNQINKKDKLAIFCTGGIRCEKVSVLLNTVGFNQVIQLDGGILNYMNADIPNSKWKGKCFVFDDRITIN